MKLLKKTEKIDSIESANIDLQLAVANLQKENQELKASVIELSKSLTVMSSTLAEKAVVQRFLVDQVAKTSELVLEIDKSIHPGSYIKFDLMNEPYN